MESAFRDPELRLIETFGWNGADFVRLDRHRARMAQSAHLLGFPFSATAFDDALPKTPGHAPLRLRLTLNRGGRFELATSPLAANPARWRLAIADGRTLASDPRHAHKTTDRALYDRARATLADGTDEFLFLNERGEATEGTITTLFFDRGDGLCTPPLACGCLPGCLRAELLEAGATREAILMEDELTQVRLWMGNSLRGLIAADLQ